MHGRGKIRDLTGSSGCAHEQLRSRSQRPWRGCRGGPISPRSSSARRCGSGPWWLIELVREQGFLPLSGQVFDPCSDLHRRGRLHFLKPRMSGDARRLDRHMTMHDSAAVLAAVHPSVRNFLDLAVRNKPSGMDLVTRPPAPSPGRALRPEFRGKSIAGASRGPWGAERYTSTPRAESTAVIMARLSGPETASIEAGMTRLAIDAHSGFAFVRIRDSWR